MNKYLKEAILWVLIIVPYLYLATIWNELPEQVPTHFNLHGEADDWSGKTMLLIIPAGMGVFIYLLMLLIPFIDPKKKLQQMADKYYMLKFMLTVFMSLLSVYLLYVSKQGSLQNPNLLIAILGGLFAMLGNYFQTVRSNYFIGIRTPWTLESEEVWKKTHQLGGRLWMAGGIGIIVLSFIIKNNLALAIAFGSIVAVLTIIPIAYSYTEFKKEKKQQ